MSIFERKIELRPVLFDAQSKNRTFSYIPSPVIHTLCASGSLNVRDCTAEGPDKRIRKHGLLAGCLGLTAGNKEAI